jgi:membrane-associated protease RseP (regulator of RpoE activity)
MVEFGIHRVSARAGAALALAMLALAALSPVARGDEAPAQGQGASLGVTTRRLSEGWRERNGFWSAGVMVVRVVTGGPAELAGVNVGDVLQSVDGRTIRDPGDLLEVEHGLESGHPVAVVLARDGGRAIRMFNLEPVAIGEPAPEIRPLTPPAPIAVREEVSPPTLAPKPAVTPAPTAAPEPAAAADAPKDAMTELGLRAQDLSPDMAAALGSAGTQGVLVLEVKSGSTAERAGFKAGDVISRVGEQAIEGVASLDKAVAAAPSLVPVTALRKGTPQEIVVALVGHPAPGAPAKAELKSSSTDDSTVEDLRDKMLIEMRDEIRALRKEVQALRDRLNSWMRDSSGGQ